VGQPTGTAVTAADIQTRYAQAKQVATALGISTALVDPIIAALGNPDKLRATAQIWSVGFAPGAAGGAKHASVKNAIAAMAGSPDGLTGNEYREVTANWKGKAETQFAGYITGSLAPAMNGAAAEAGTIGDFLNDVWNKTINYWATLLDIINAAIAACNAFLSLTSAAGNIAIDIVGSLGPGGAALKAGSMLSASVQAATALNNMLSQIVSVAKALLKLYQDYKNSQYVGLGAANTYIAGTEQDHLPVVPGTGKTMADWTPVT
jgi:hypothetical protein